jgi:hypothetical protein
MESVQIHGFDDFEGGGAHPLILGVDSASLTQTYLNSKWGVPTPKVDNKYRNPFHVYNSLSDVNKVVLKEWLPWLKGDEPFLKDIPVLSDPSDKAKGLHGEWKRKNELLTDGYGKYDAWLKSEKIAITDAKTKK